MILSRDPVPGRVKTRLQPALGPEGAARLHAALTRLTVQTAVRSGLDVRLALDGLLEGGFATEMRELGAQVQDQGPGDLGQRLRRACAEPGRVVCIGTDCPSLQAADLVGAAARPGVCFGPAEDGGYWLVALDGGQEPLLSLLFDGIPWSTAQTLAVSRQRLAAQGIDAQLLPTRADLDTPADLSRLRADPSCPAALLPLL